MGNNKNGLNGSKKTKMMMLLKPSITLLAISLQINWLKWDLVEIWQKKHYSTQVTYFKYILDNSSAESAQTWIEGHKNDADLNEQVFLEGQAFK